VGLLLLLPRTRTLGALALLPIAINITVLDFCFGFPSVKYFALTHLVLAFLLVATDLERLRPLFAREELPASARPLPRWLRRTIGVLAAALTLFFANLVFEAASAGPAEPARRAAVQAGWSEESLRYRRDRRQGAFGIGRTAQVDFELEGSAPARLRVHLRRFSGFVPWKAVSVEELAPAALD
jgi:hypothetical protein